MEIIKEFLPEKEFKELYDLITHHDFAWYVTEKVTCDIKSPVRGYERTESKKQLCHTFINDYSRSIYLDRLGTLFERMKVKTVYRVKANLTFNRGKRNIGGWHYDREGAPKGTKSSVLYLNSNNGFTLLEDGTKIYSEANTLVSFDNDILHTGVSQTDTEDRLLLNINYKD